jgi:hypothetical protein
VGDTQNRLVIERVQKVGQPIHGTFGQVIGLEITTDRVEKNPEEHRVRKWKGVTFGSQIDSKTKDSPARPAKKYRGPSKWHESIAASSAIHLTRHQ